MRRWARRRGAPLVAVVVTALGALLVAGVLQVRPATAADATTLARAGDGGAGRVPSTGPARPAAGADLEAGLVLRRGGTASITLGQAVGDLAEGWRTTGVGQQGCELLVWHGGGAGSRRAAPSPAAEVRLHGWARGGRVVAVRVDAPSTPGLLLPTAVRTGWSLEAVLAGSDGLLHPGTGRGPSGEAETVLTGRLPVDAWPPEPPPARRAGQVVAAEPPQPSVDLVLGDAGTGQVVSAEVRVPAARGCAVGPDPGRAPG